MKYIGIVDWTNEDRNGTKVGGVKPLYEISKSGLKLSDPSDFGDHQMAFWYKAVAKQDDLIFFTVKESYKDDGYKYNLASYELAKEVLDFRNLGTVDKVRKAFDTGVGYSGHLPEKAYIWCEGGSIIGPISLYKSDNLLRYTASQIHKIACYSIDDTPLYDLNLDSKVRHICKDQSPLNICSYVDWDTNRNVLKRAIDFAVDKSGKNEITGINVKQLIIDTYQQLKDADNSAELSLEINRLKRATEIIKQVDISDEWAEELIENLLALPVIKEQLKLIRKKVEDEVKIVFNKQLETENEELEKFREERDKLLQELLDYEDQLEKIKEKIDLQTGEIEEEIRKRIETAITKPADIIAQSAFLKAILPYISANSVPAPTNGFSASHSVIWKKSDEFISTNDELKIRLRQAFRAVGVKQEVGTKIHAAFAANLMPILTGFNASAALEAYSQIACGGRILSINVTPTTIDPSGLFGNFDSANNALVSENNLLRFIETANQYYEPAVIVFEGINRAPTESYFIPLLKSIFFKKSLSVNLGNNGIRNCNWSENLLIAATLVDGPTTLPLCSDIWSRAIYIDARGELNDGEYDSFSEIDMNSDLFEIYVTSMDIDHILVAFPELKEYKTLAMQYLGGLEHFYDSASQADEEQLEKILFETIICPLIAALSSDEERENAVEKLAALKIKDFKDSDAVKTYLRNVIRKIA